MLDIYAKTFMTATRTPCIKVRSVPSHERKNRARWPWRNSRTTCIDPEKL